MTIRAFLILCLASVATCAQAATWSEISALDGKYTIAGNNGQNIVVTVDPSADDAYFSVNKLVQSPGAIESEIETQFGTVYYVGKCNSYGAECENGSVTPTSGGVRLSTSPAGFNYLALHFGNGHGVSELLFYWSVAVSQVTVSGLDSFSNFRAYSAVNPVPLPGAALLFLSALGIGAATRKRKAAVV